MRLLEVSRPREVRSKMAKPIKENPVLQGKAARKFDQMFVSNSKPDPEKIERHKKDVDVFRQTRSK